MPYAAGQKLRASDMPGSSFARYYKSIDQTGLAVGAVTGIRYQTATDTTADLTASAIFDLFTVNKAGVWHIDATSRVVTGVWVSGLDRLEGFLCLAAATGNNSVRYSGVNGFDIQDSNYNGSFTLMGNVAVTRRFNVNDTIACNAVLNNADNPWSLTGLSEQVQISFTWMGP